MGTMIRFKAKQRMSKRTKSTKHTSLKAYQQLNTKQEINQSDKGKRRKQMTLKPECFGLQKRLTSSL